MFVPKTKELQFRVFIMNLVAACNVLDIVMLLASLLVFIQLEIYQVNNVGIFVIHVRCGVGNGNAVVKLGFPLTEIQKGKTHVNGIRGSTLYIPDAGTSKHS